MERVSSEIRSLAQSGSVVFAVSHDSEFLLSACDCILHLRDGIIVDGFTLDGSARERLLRSLWKGAVQWGCSCRRVDPRTALLATCLLGIVAVLSNQPEAAHAACAIGALCALVSGAWRPRIALSAAYGLIAAVMALAEGAGNTTLVIAAAMLSYMAQKFVVLALLGISLSKLASMQDLLAVLQSMGTPQVVLIPCMSFCDSSQLYAWTPCISWKARRRGACSQEEGSHSDTQLSHASF